VLAGRLPAHFPTCPIQTPASTRWRLRSSSRTCSTVTPRLAPWYGSSSPGGRLGVSCWASSPSETPPGKAAQETVRRFLNDERLTEGLRTALPWESRFAAPGALEAALCGAGLRDTRVEQREYEVEMSTISYVESRLISLSSRFMQSCLPADHWQRFKDELASELCDRFGPRIAFTVRTNLGVGAKPGPD
jgi:hypothetical protein